MIKYTAGDYTATFYEDSGVIQIKRLHPNGSGEELEKMTIYPSGLPDLKHVLARAEKAKEDSAR